METDLRDHLREEFERQAKCRRIKAADSPDDARNEEAAEIFDKLAASTRDIDLAVLQAYRELQEGFEDSEEHSEIMRQVGFYWWPESAEEFRRKFIAERTGA